MTKRHTRLFFLVGTILFSLVFAGLTIDSHRQFDRLTRAENLTDEVIAGNHVWHRNNCVNCHTLFGEGAYFAPDLTKITQLRGRAYLTAFLRDPSQFYSERVHRRMMPNPNLSDTEIANVVTFLEWVSNIDNQGWPPRPIVVTSGSFTQVRSEPSPTTAVSTNPVDLGTELFHSPALGCQACHSTRPDVTLAGPSLAGISKRAAAMVSEPSYTGSAKDAEGYIREAILEPSVYISPGPNFSSGPDGISLMPSDYGTRLDPEQVEHLVAYLMTLR